MNIMSSLKGLERIGAEDSKTVKKIKEAGGQAADHIIKNNFCSLLPGYSVSEGDLFNEGGERIWSGMNRQTALDFARDIAKAGLVEAEYNANRER